MSKELRRPTLLLNVQRARQNIERMATKAQRSGVRFRPHFKTHQSTRIGRWFRDYGVQAITVSSVDMAWYFARDGWRDITIAFPVNLCQLDEINSLARKVRLGLVVESTKSVWALREQMKATADAWIKVDVGYGRTGLAWDDATRLTTLAEEIERSPNLRLRGLLTHAGHAYRARSHEEIVAIYQESVARLNGARQRLQAVGFTDLELSTGDTPCCSVVDHFGAVDEVRPGNFVFYDAMQLCLGTCSERDLAVAVACPVVARHEERDELVIWGGAVHFSKDAVSDGKRTLYGLVALPADRGWGPLVPEAYVAALSQEHGIVKAEGHFVRKVQPGDLLIIVPAHACLAVAQMRQYLTTEGKVLKTCGI
ncbi:MAG: alanine racemase [bacterium]|nr:alanine racemase [candidate division KSB1 bacterium]MDH7560765.1 alanine racemase [bacterium]